MSYYETQFARDVDELGEEAAHELLRENLRWSRNQQVRTIAGRAERARFRAECERIREADYGYDD